MCALAAGLLWNVNQGNNEIRPLPETTARAIMTACMMVTGQNSAQGGDTLPNIVRPPVASSALSKDDKDHIEARLRAIYYYYIQVKFCHDARDGYAMVYVNDVEFEQARRFVTELEASALTKDKDHAVDTKALWTGVDSSLNGKYMNRYSCQEALHTLVRIYRAAHPNNPTVEKDF
jgi:hypothetical protein